MAEAVKEVAMAVVKAVETALRMAVAVMAEARVGEGGGVESGCGEALVAAG